MQDSQKRVNNFGKGIRRIVAATALGVGAFAAGKGLASLLKMSSAGAKAISKWSIAWAKFKQQVARLIAGPAAKLITWLAKGLGIITDWLSKQTSIQTAFGNFVALSVTWLMNVKAIRDAWFVIIATITVAKGLFKAFVAIGSKALTDVLKEWARLSVLVFSKMLDWSVKIYNIWQQIMQFIANATASVAGTIGKVGSLFGFSDSPKSSAPKEKKKSEQGIAWWPALRMAQKVTADIADARKIDHKDTAAVESMLLKLGGAINSLDTAARKLNGASVQQGRLQLQSGPRVNGWGLPLAGGN